MQNTNLLNFQFTDGLISMHVSVTEFKGNFGTRYSVSWSNSMRNDLYKNEPFDRKEDAMQRGFKLRGYMYADMAVYLQQVM